MQSPNEKQLSEAQKQWILENYKPHLAEFGFSALAQKFGVIRKTIQALFQSPPIVPVEPPKAKPQRKFKASPKPSPVVERDPVIYFGKHKGLKYSQLPIEYLKWMKREIKSPEKTVLQVENELRRRNGESIPIVEGVSQFNPKTHYKWTHPDGDVTYEIPNDVSMVGTENELPPF